MPIDSIASPTDGHFTSVSCSLMKCVTVGDGTASDRAGKTALSQTLTKDLWKNGKLPLLLNAQKIDSKIAHTIQKHLDHTFKEQYATAKVSAFCSCISRPA